MATDTEPATIETRLGTGPKSQVESDLERRIALDPIHLPANPYWEVIRDFGSDELVSLALTVAGTVAMTDLIDSNTLVLTPAQRNLALSFIGPIAEKFGFLPRPFMKAWRVYRTMPSEHRDSLGYYMGKAARECSRNLAWDILVQDLLLYVPAMHTVLKKYPDTTPWLLSVGIILAATAAVSVLQVAVTEGTYAKYKHQLTRAGFEFEPLVDANFFVSCECDPKELIEDMAKRFGLSDLREIDYQDRYFRSSLPQYSGRVPSLRLRRRGNYFGDRILHSAEVVYTKPREVHNHPADQYRYFMTRKDKLKFYFTHDIPDSMEGIQDAAAREMLTRAQKGNEFTDVSFRRTAVRDERLLVSVDHVVDCERPFYLVELKTHKHVDLLREAMRYLMLEFPVVETTQDKVHLVRRH